VGLEREREIEGNESVRGAVRVVLFGLFFI